MWIEASLKGAHAGLTRCKWLKLLRAWTLPMTFSNSCVWSPNVSTKSVTFPCFDSERRDLVWPQTADVIGQSRSRTLCLRWRNTPTDISDKSGHLYQWCVTLPNATVIAARRKNSLARLRFWGRGRLGQSKVSGSRWDTVSCWTK